MRELVYTPSQIPPFDRREILRYAGARGEADEGTEALLNACLQECESLFTYRVCWIELTREQLATITGATGSKNLSAALGTSKSVLLFAATVGVGIDRLIARYATLSPAKALLFQAIGAERIEALCDYFCKEQGEKRTLGRRFSPGYGDFPLSAQRDLLRTVKGERIGISLTESLMMLPTKSVTALVGIGESACENACAQCEKEDCQFRV